MLYGFLIWVLLGSCYNVDLKICCSEWFWVVLVNERIIFFNAILSFDLITRERKGKIPFVLPLPTIHVRNRR